MNNLTPSNSRPMGPVTPSSGRTASKVLQASERLQEPWRLRDELFADYPEWSRAIYAAIPSLDRLRHPEHGDRARLDAEDYLAKLPPAEELEAFSAAILRVEQAEPDRGQVLALISVMIDGFPNARPHNPEAYIEGLLHEVMVAGYQSAVVAVACRTVVRTEKFPPAISEFLKACEDAAKSLGWRERAIMALECRAKVEHLLSEADRLGPRDLRGEWRDHVRSFKETGSWPPGGPKPGDRWCTAPADILAEFGFASAGEEVDQDGRPKIVF